MKRKFILYPAVALALMTSVSLSSCVDTDEPESLEKLREAVAQREKAQAGYIDAKSEVEKAYVAVVNAKAQLEVANAKAQEIANAAAELQNLLQESANAVLISNDKETLAENEATFAAKVEAAKIVAEKTLDKAKEEYQVAIERNKKDLQIDILKIKRDLALFMAEGEVGAGEDAKPELLQALTEWNNAVNDVADAQVTLNDALKGASLQNEEDLHAAQKALEQAKTDKATYEELLKPENYGAIIEEWKSLKATETEFKLKAYEEAEEMKKLEQNREKTAWNQDLNLDEWLKAEAEKQNKIVEGYDKDKTYAKVTEGDNKHDGSIKWYEQQKEDLKTNIKNSTVGNKDVDAYKDAESRLEFALDNATLLDFVKDVTFSNFIYDEAGKRYVSKEKVKNSEIATTVAELQNAFLNYGGELEGNVNSYQYITNKFNDAESTAKKAITETSGENLYTVWTNAVTKLKAATTQAGVAEWQPKYEDATKKLFGVYNGTEWVLASTDFNIAWFFNADLCNLEKNDKITDLILSKNLTDLSKKEQVWDKLGAYGAWRKAQANNTNEAKSNVYTAASTLLKAISDKVDTYEKTLKEKEQSAALAFAITDADIEAMDVVKAAQAAIDKAKEDKAKAEEAKAKAWEAYNNCKYVTEKKRIEAICDDVQKGHNDEIMTLLAGYIKADLEGADDAALKDVASFETYTKFVLAEFDDNIAQATNEVEKLEAKIAELKDENYDHYSDILTAVRDLAEKQKTEAEKKAHYEILKAAYGK